MYDLLVMFFFLFGSFLLDFFQIFGKKNKYEATLRIGSWFLPINSWVSLGVQPTHPLLGALGILYTGGQDVLLDNYYCLSTDKYAWSWV